MNWLLFRNSLLLGGCSTALAVGFGFVGALCLAGLPARLRTGVLGAGIIALALPPFLVTNSWLHFLGLVGSWHRWLPVNIFSLPGAIWVVSLLLWPVTLLLVWGAWQRLEPAQLESDMKVKGWALLRGLLFPLARNALLEASFLTFVLAVNNFAVPTILQVKVFPAEMWIRFNTEFDTLGALRLSLPLALGPILLVMWLLRHDVPWPHLQTVVPGRLIRQQLGHLWFWSSSLVTVLLLVCAIVLPLAQILSSARTWTELPGAWAAGKSAVWNSFWYAAAAATIAGVISVFFSVRAQTSHTPVRTEVSPRPWLRGIGPRILLGAGWVPFLLPGVLIGIALIQAFNHGWSAAFYQSCGIVLLALVIRYLVISWSATSQAMQRVDRDLIDVALVEGATARQVFRHVLWPQTTRAILASWYIVFLLCLWDVESVILIVPPGGETLALRIFNLLHYGHNAQVNALCFVLVGVALLPLGLGTMVQLVRSRWCATARPA